MLEKEVEAAFSDSPSSDSNRTPAEMTARNLMDKLKYFLYTDIESTPRVMVCWLHQELDIDDHSKVHVADGCVFLSLTRRKSYAC